MKKAFFYLSILIISWLYSLMYLVADWDLWARLTVGKIFFQTGLVLKKDFISYTITKPVWVDHEWGSGVIFYFLSNHFGDAGLLVFKIVSIFLILFIISKIVELNNPKPDAHMNLLFYLLSLWAMSQGISSTVRCQMFTFLFFTLWIYALERVRRGENRLLWIFPVSMILWANLHGGFVSGIGLLLIYGLGEFLNKKSYKKYILVLIPTILVTLINPYGLKYLSYIFEAVTMLRPTITEWASSFATSDITAWLPYKLFFLTSLITVAFSFLKNGFDFKKMDKVKYLLLAVTLYLSVKHIKHQAFFAIAGCSFLYHDFYVLVERAVEILKLKASFIRDKTWDKFIALKNIVLIFLIVVGGSFYILKTPMNISISKDKYPAGSIEFIKKNKISGNLLTVFHWGSYAAWKLYPQCMLAIDGRYEEVYPEKINYLTSNFMLKNTSDWKKFLKIYHTDIILINTSYKGYEALRQEKDWEEVYSDKTSAVFVPSKKVKTHYIKKDLPQKYFDKIKYATGIDF